MAFGFHVYKDNRGEYRWRFEAANGKIQADSGEGYKSKQHCIDGMVAIMHTDTKTPWYDETGEK